MARGYNLVYSDPGNGVNEAVSGHLAKSGTSFRANSDFTRTTIRDENVFTGLSEVKMRKLTRLCYQIGEGLLLGQVLLSLYILLPLLREIL